MANKENLEKCPEYINGGASEGDFRNEKVVICNVDNCIYYKALKTTYHFKEKITICKSQGWLKKTEIDNPEKIKKLDNLEINFQSDLEDTNPANMRYVQFKQPQSQPSI